MWSIFQIHDAEMNSQLILSLSVFHVISAWLLTWKRFHNNDQVSAFLQHLIIT